MNEITEREEKLETISFFRFYSYIRLSDKLLLVTGALSAILAGGVMPSIAFIMGNVAAAFSGGDDGGGSDIVGDMSAITSLVFLVSCLMFLFSYVFFAFW